MKKINCILLVDDNSADNEFHSIAIRKANVCNHIKIAMDGIEALEYIEKSGDPGHAESFPKPDLIFLDINMPRMNGFEFIAAYNKLEISMRSGIWIAMLTTSFASKETPHDINTFLIKPLTAEMVREIVEKHF